MALINCKECNKQISDTTSVCIGCGAKVSKVKPESKGKNSFIKIGLIILGVIWVLGLITKGDGSGVSQSVSHSDSPVPIENNADIQESFTKNNYANLSDVVAAIKLRGNSCDTVSSARVSVIDGAWSIQCNSLRYEYEIKDVGGKIEMMVIR